MHADRAVEIGGGGPEAVVHGVVELAAFDVPRGTDHHRLRTEVGDGALHLGDRSVGILQRDALTTLDAALTYTDGPDGPIEYLPDNGVTPSEQVWSASLSVDTAEAVGVAQPGVRILRYDKPFNYSRLNNFAAQHVRGSILIFLNNDTEVLGQAIALKREIAPAAAAYAQELIGRSENRGPATQIQILDECEVILEGVVDVLPEHSGLLADASFSTVVTRGSLFAPRVTRWAA